jgi:hypothetical protein
MLGRSKGTIQMRKSILICLVLLAALPLAAQQQTAPQLRLPRPSQKASVTQTIGLTDMTITYSRPGVKGRVIWGGLVPYDKVWRTGANEATTISFSDDVMINGQPLPKGAYSLHTIPGRDSWTIIFNKTANQWGSFSYDAAQDALRVTVKPEKADFREWMSFDIPQLSTDSATVAIRWENLAVPFTVNTGTAQKVLADVRAALAAAKPDDWRTPYRAANFANDNRMPDDAAKWLDQSIKAQENINNLYLKARMQARAGDRMAAIYTAERAISKATPQDAEEVAEIRKDIDAWKASK